MSNELKATPGPWSVVNGGDIFGPLGGDSGDGLKADKNDGWKVAEVDRYAASCEDELVEMGKDVMKANAHLIAASPELYESLSTLVRHAEKLGRSATIYDDARRILAKARGEKS